MATALISALTGTPVSQYVAMTGEVTLRGRVLPIGGLREKTMAAYRMGIKTVIIPRKNLPDLAEIDDKVKGALNFVSAAGLDEVFDATLLRVPEGGKTVAAVMTPKESGRNAIRI